MLEIKLDIPWVESPFFQEILEAKLYDLSDDYARLAKQFHDDGYILIDLQLPERWIVNIIAAIKANVLSFKPQRKMITYSDSQRLFEGWRFNEYIAELALNATVIKMLGIFYDREPFPFQTINFSTGSQHRAHSDSLHFATIPQRWMAAAWVALEATDSDNGAFYVCPASHKLKIYDFNDLGLPLTRFGGETTHHRLYGEFMDKLIEAHKLERRPIYMAPGQAVITAANLIHGGMPIVNKARTRYSQVTHYFFDGCEHYYAPMLSKPLEGIYAEKDLSAKNIRDYHFNKLWNR